MPGGNGARVNDTLFLCCAKSQMAQADLLRLRRRWRARISPVDSCGISIKKRKKERESERESKRGAAGYCNIYFIRPPFLLCIKLYSISWLLYKPSIFSFSIRGEEGALRIKRLYGGSRDRRGGIRDGKRGEEKKKRKRKRESNGEGRKNQQKRLKRQ